MLQVEYNFGSYVTMKSTNMTDIDDIASKWKPSDGIKWDLIQRMRFMNADAEIAPDDKYTREYFEKLKKEKDE